MRGRWSPLVSPRLAVTAVAVTFAAALVVAAAPVAGADPLNDADQTVERLRREADQASGEYFDALAKAQALDAQIAGIEERLPGIAKRLDRLRDHLVSRAVIAYQRGGGQQLASIIDSHDALTAARRTQWLTELNARDRRIAKRVRQTRNRLDAQRGQLTDAQAAQKSALEQVQARGRDIDAKLGAAMERRRELQAEAAAAAAAAAAEAAARAQANAPASSASTPAGPTAPPPAYTPTPGVHPKHNEPFLMCTRAHESGGNYRAYNPAGPYMGAYQFLQATWNSAANHAGRVELIGVPPNTASEYDQDDMAWALYQWRGNGPWNGRC